jgi:branched-subunit amino acid transport protein
VSRVWTAIVVAGIGTFAMRASFLAFAHRLSEVPPAVQRVLRQIPPAALASLVIPAFVRPHGELDLFQPRLAAGLLATLVAWRTKNIALTLLVGMATLMLLDAL